MRYTTIIDISEIPRLYNNNNAVRLYLHFALKCGYHDHDRDMITVSIRQLSRTLHMTIAATRHALHVAQRKWSTNAECLTSTTTSNYDSSFGRNVHNTLLYLIQIYLFHLQYQGIVILPQGQQARVRLLQR